MSFGSTVEFFYKTSSRIEPLCVFSKISRVTMVDDLDKEILKLLTINGRDSARTIGKKLAEKGIKISERGIGKRIAKLERDKIIQGYTTLVDLPKVDMPIMRLITVRFTSPKDFVQRLEEMRGYLKEAPFCDFSARTNGDIDWIELKFFNNQEQAQKEEDLYRAWFGDIIEDYRSHDLDIDKAGWQLFNQRDFELFIQSKRKKEELNPKTKHEMIDHHVYA